MRRNKSGNPQRKTTIQWKAGALALAMSAALSGQAHAQVESCDPDLDVTIQQPARVLFEGDIIRVSADIGAADIKGGTHMDIHAMGYALNFFQDSIVLQSSEQLLHEHASPYQYVALILLSLLFLFSILRKGARGFLSGVFGHQIA